MYDRRTLDEARRDLAAWLKKWSERYPKLCDRVEGNIDETFTFDRLPRQHHKNLNRPTCGKDSTQNSSGERSSFGSFQCR
jgi:transposase-like protein